MFSSSQMYSKLFRPWDAIEEKLENERKFILEDKLNVKAPTEQFKTECIKIDYRHRKNLTDKGNKLRKVRNICKPGINQDCTISTTTDELPFAHSITLENVPDQYTKNNIEEINKRLGYPVEAHSPKENSNECDKKKCSKFNINSSAIISKQKNIVSLPLNCERKGEIIKDKLSNFQSIQSSSKGVSSCNDESSSLHQSPLLNYAKNQSVLNTHYQESMIMQHPEYYSYPVESFSSHQGRYPAELLSQTDIAQSLGIPPTDPLLMESFAHGYAMELEYARIMHQETQAKLLNARKQRPKKYRCPHCDVGFSNNGQLKGHVRIHTGERPFKCDDKTCGKTFTRNEELTRHRRIHSGLRPYPCQTCGKKFGRRDHLKKHTRTHMVQAERMMPMFVPLTGLSTVAGYPYLYGY